MTPLKRVLIVDDNETDLKKMGTIFESKGVEVTYAKNGLEAFDWLEHNGHKNIDAIISDVVMPEMNGLELSRHVGGTYPVILVSEDGELPLLTDEYLDLIQAYIEKKDCKQTLFRAAEKAVERWSDEGQEPVAA